MSYNITSKHELDSIIEKIKGGDSLFVSSIECIGNSIYDITKTLEHLEKNKIYLLISNSIELDFRKGSNENKHTIELLKSICDIQRNRIRNNVQKAKDSGKSLGRKKLCKNDLPPVFIGNLNDFYLKKINKTEFAKICKCSRPTLNAWLTCVSNGE